MDAIAEFNDLGSKDFLRKYRSGHGAKSHFINFGGKSYPAKAIWVVAKLKSGDGPKAHTSHALDGLSSMGFDLAASDVEEYEATEGQRRVREIQTLSRSPKLVAEAKKKHGYKCMACGFDYTTKYGELGEGFVECHHLVPVSERGDEGEITSVDDLAVLCANCHRMIHRRSPCLELSQLQVIIRGAEF